MVEDLLVRLAVEEGLHERDALVLGQLRSHFEVRLVDLRETGVDDLLVQLVLLLEAEHLRRLLGQNVDDAVEHLVVQVGVVDRDRLDLLAELLREADGGVERRERLRRAVDADQDGVARRFVGGRDVLHDPDVPIALAGDAVGDRPDDAVTHPPDAERADDHEIVVRRRHVAQDLDVVLAVHHPGLERETGLAAALRHRLEVRVADQLQSHGDQAVVNLPLALQLDLVEVLLGERVLHLPEAVVVHAGGVDVAPDQLGAEGAAERHAALDGAVGMLGIVDRYVDALVHDNLRWPPRRPGSLVPSVACEPRRSRPPRRRKRLPRS